MLRCLENDSLTGFRADTPDLGTRALTHLFGKCSKVNTAL